jgi:hypothetical protein
LFSSKTYKESSAARQETESQFSNMSSESWKEWVIEQRQEYSQRKKSAHLIRESESSSWPTATVFDTTGGSYPTEMVDGVYRSKHSQEPNSPWYGAKLKDAVETHEKSWPTPTIAEVSGGMRLDQIKSGKWHNIQLREKIALLEEEKQDNWPTATTRDWKDTNATVPPSRANPSKQTLGQRVAHVGLQDRANPNTNGKSQESWLTPRTSQAMSATITENLVNQNVGNLEEQQGRQSIGGKLNPNWVEHLMGLPAGWTDLGSWETE